MIYNTKIFKLKNGVNGTFRSPVAEDAAEMCLYLKTCATETHFILREPEECTETAENEAKFLEDVNASETGVMIVCTVDGEIAGNCQISFNKRIKIQHRASVAIGILKKFWGMVIGTIMFEEMIEFAKNYGVTQLELEFVEGNERAKGLYEKMGFAIVAEKPDAFRLKDGTMLKEYSMIKYL